MKTKKNKPIRKFRNIIIIILMALVYFALFSGYKSVDTKKIINSALTQTKEFVHIIFNSRWYGALDRDPNPRYLALDSNISSYRDSLSFNGIHIYGFDAITSGGFEEELEYYIGGINSQISRIESAGLKGYYGRNKIEVPSYAQRLEYEAEGGNDGFSYQLVMGQSVNPRPDIIIEDSGRTVVHLDSGDTPGFLCDSIYENLQHGDFFDFNQRDAGYWYLRPVMRISSENFNPLDTTPVISIIIRNFEGNNIDTIIIKKLHFKNENNIYNGQYLSNYYDLIIKVQGHPDSTKSINGGITTTWENWDTQCKVDFKIYWHGLVDIWFDKLIVDDEPADLLFNQGLYDARVTNEINNINFDYNNSRLIVDELTYSQLLAFKHVVDTVQKIKPQIKFNVAQTYYLHRRSLKNDTLGIRRFLELSKPESFNMDIHPIPWILPDNISGGFNGDSLVSKEAYTNELQNNSFGDKTTGWSYIKEISFARQQRDGLTTCLPQLIIQPQIHGWMFKDSDDTTQYLQSLREPLNEELQVQAMLAIAHGAEGLCWFVYQSEYKKEIIPGEGERITYCFGLTDPNDETRHRHNNLYNQDKWKYVSDMNDKLKKWTAVLNNTDWQGGYSVHSEGAGNEYISDIKSIKRNPYSPYNFSETNIDTVKYWEEGFFEPKVTSVNDRSKYFLIVNRRCVPEVDGGEGDIRWLKIKFNSTSLSEFRNWKLEDVYTGESIIFNRLDTTSGGYIDLGNQQGDMGYFLPGEGKLFKLAPIIQEGGTLVCDEFLSSGSINCDSTVFNDGFDITINKDVTINFLPKGEIVVEEEEFICGLDQHFSKNRLELNNAIFQTTERKFTDFKSFLFFQYLNVKS